MKHPSQEEWIAFLYHETDLSTSAQLKAHLASCPDCRAQLEQWQRVQKHLDAWQLPKPASRPPGVVTLPRVLRWAAAALITIAIGFGLGRSTLSGQLDPETIAELRNQLRDELNQSFDARLAAAQQETTAAIRQLAELTQSTRLADNQAISTALSQIKAAQAAEFLSLRRDLETVALNSDVGLRQTRQQLVRLADYSQAPSPAP